MPHSNLTIEQLTTLMPATYVEGTGSDDLDRQARLLALLFEDPAGDRVFRDHAGNQETLVHRFDVGRLRESLRSMTPSFGAEASRLRLVSRLADEDTIGFQVCVFDADAQGQGRPDWAREREEFVDSEGRLVRHVTTSSHQVDGRTTLSMTCINTAQTTLWRNLLEVFESHQVFPTFLEVWQQVVRKGSVRAMHRMEAVFEGGVDQAVAASMEQDLERYLQVVLQPMSVLDLIGPAMVGPSSSHTAGANRIGQLARNILVALQNNGSIHRIDRLQVRLLGSFRDTGVGHRTPAALGGGLCGLASDDEGMLARGEPERMGTEPLEIGDMRAPFAGYGRGTQQDDARYAAEGNANVAEIIVDTDAGPLTITGFSIGGGNVEIRHVGERLSSPIDGTQDAWLEGRRVAGFGSVAPTPSCAKVAALQPAASEMEPDYRPAFNTFEELLDHVTSNETDLIAVIVEHERRLRGLSEPTLRERMGAHWRVMRAAVERGRGDDRRSPLGLTGGDGRRIARFIDDHPLFDNLAGRALAYATSVGEQNACSGVVVACPTAGACGILPGVLRAYEELAGVDERCLVDGLLVAGLMGVVLFDDVSTAGADYGCQAEIGAAAAMAAAALTHMTGGNAEAVVHAFVLAIKNTMGLVCDPVAGLVEVPCVKRNGLYSNVAIGAAAMALAGVRSFISPDEVVLAVREVGARLHRDYRETSGGGLARTRDGKRVLMRFQHEIDRWFSRR